MLERLMMDVRFSVRSLRRSPGFAFVAVLSLALGIGACATLFSLIDAIFFRPFPVHEPKGLVALSLVLLAGAGLFLRTLVRAQSIDLGVRLDDVLVVSIDLSSMRFRYDESKTLQFYRAALDRIRSLPGVVGVTSSNDLPFNRANFRRWFVKEGATVGGESDWIGVDANITGPRYLETLGIGLMRGRDFTDRDRGKQLAARRPGHGAC